MVKNMANFIDTLETAVDYTSLGEIVGMLSAIASDKAEHILSCYGDERLAADWQKASDALLKLAEECEL
jgi:hypothetical protein